VLIAQVAVPVPLGRAFSYAVPDALALGVAPGVRVLCPFGARKMLGVVLEVVEGEPSFDKRKLRALSAVVDTEPVLPPELLAFLRELAAYYFAPIGEVLRIALPALERSQVHTLQKLVGDGPTPRARRAGGRTVTIARLAPASELTAEAPAKLRGRTRELYDHLCTSREAPVPHLEQLWKGARAAVKRLAALGLVELHQKEVAAGAYFAEAIERDVPPDLTGSQASAGSALAEAIASGAVRSFLLFGVTGSGKTEVYLRAIDACLRAGKGALVLVPEIALTPQLVGRFRARFGDDVAVIHSGLREGERHSMWRRLRSGELQVAIGARSALFAPVQRLGLIVVDEEHDGSFKQEEGARYHARDMALLRAHRAGAVAVLGSATPSLETEMLARQGKLVRLEPPSRSRANFRSDRFRSTPSSRAFALTFHRVGVGQLLCHYCDFACALPERCPECRADKLVLEGLGTEKLEGAISAAFPQARVARLDRDVASGAKAEQVLERVRSGEVDILVGTQMVTKGHDLPRVTLVGVINADASLSMPDYRAAERAFQSLVQVAGRAGRNDRPGTVIIQTRNPEHPAVDFASRHDVRGFIEHELRDREELGYPPYARLALLRIDGEDEARARESSQELCAAAMQSAPVLAREVHVLGPAVAPLARLRGRYRFQILLRAKERRPLRQVVLALLPTRERLLHRVRIAIDVDPVQMM